MIVTPVAERPGLIHDLGKGLARGDVSGLKLSIRRPDRVITVIAIVPDNLIPDRDRQIGWLEGMVRDDHRMLIGLVSRYQQKTSDYPQVAGYETLKDRVMTVTHT
jgi:hypothetical protein